MKVEYTGSQINMILMEYGPVAPGDTIEVSDELGERLLVRGDFEEVTEEEETSEKAPEWTSSPDDPPLPVFGELKAEDYASVQTETTTLEPKE